MGFKKSKSRKCPVCVACTTERVRDVNLALAPVLEDVKSTGEIPKPVDKRFEPISHQFSLSPWSLQYHLKTCLVDLEIQDQRLIELKDLAQALSTAKQEYQANPGVGQAQALAALMGVFMTLAKDIEGQEDPEATVTFIVETVLNPMGRKTLAALSEESRNFRETMKGLVSPSQQVYVSNQADLLVKNVAAHLRDMLDDSLKRLTTYYKVELEARARKRMMESGSSLPSDDTSLEEDPIQ
jgi:hypothetical protein